MSINYRMAYNNRDTYVDLFPKTKISNIIQANNSLRFSKLIITLPPYNGKTQILPVAVSSKQSESFFYVKLIGDSNQEKFDYSTISQIEIKDKNLIVTRLRNMPKGNIQLELIFKESGINEN